MSKAHKRIGTPWLVGKKRVLHISKEELGRRISESKKGTKRPDMLGENNIAKRLEVRKKISEKLVGKKRTPEVREARRAIRAKQKFNRVSSLEKRFAMLLDALLIESVPQYAIQNKEMGLLTFVDFYIPERNLCIFIDGEYWHNIPRVKERDVFVNDCLRRLGYKVLRFWGEEVTSLSCVDTMKIYV